MLSRILVVLISLYSTTIRADEPASVQVPLGGPRKVVATIAEQDGNFDINVRMIGVGSFDKATNNRLNREKARTYAMHALARHLGIKKTFAVKGVTLGEAHNEGKTYSLMVTVPKNGLDTTSQTEGEATPKEDKTAKIDLGKFLGLLSVKEDYIATLQEFSKTIAEDLPPTPADLKRENDFLRSVADLEESGVKSLASLRKEVKADKRLLAVEVDEVVALIEKEETAFIERLKQQVDQFQANVQGE